MHKSRLVVSRVLRSAWVLAAVGLAACTLDHVQGDDESDIYEDVSAITVPIANPSFESDKANWGDPDLFEISTSDTHTGTKSAKIGSSTGKFEQTVTVSPNTSYTLAVWVLGKGTVGVKSGSTVLGSSSASTSTWTQVTVSFNSGSASSVTIYGAYNGGTGRFDDFTLSTSGSSTTASSSSSVASSSVSSSSVASSSVSSSSVSSSSVTGGGGSGGGVPAVYPSDVLDLTNWKLTLPIDTSHAGSPDEIKQPELTDYVLSPYFRLNATGDAVVFRAHTGGYTTSGSGYPRSELREMKNNGADNASWSSSSGTHSMFIDQKITHLPVVKPHIVVGQIHDSSDDVIVFRLEDKKLFIDLNGNDGPILNSNYTLGTRFTVKFEVSNNQVKCYYNGALKYTYPKTFSGAYFKAGAYTQSSCQGDKQVAGESCSAYGEVEIYDVQILHQ
ncbi:polysaccharide lyase family 7 protein [Polyangium aurulentum]|uniref:polysaccharide lyase family 7 protein n=1 Tax=Polyangium aurulentum TaxID=2567896 RepID=UPI00197E667F|nr:polysaccharide lyase family 7 protein [Polyangium aurulentum]UQA57188.1 polysaccharide lyase family 7 protein [Polyangium aurulentum]